MKHLLKSRAAKNCVRKKWKEKLIRKINNFVEEGQIELLLFNRQRESAQWKDEDWNVSVNILFAFSTTTRTLYSSHQQGFVERVLLFFVLAALDEKRSKTKKSLQVIRILFFKFRKANKSHSNETEKDSNWFHFVIETFPSINFLPLHNYFSSCFPQQLPDFFFSSPQLFFLGIENLFTNYAKEVQRQRRLGETHKSWVLFLCCFVTMRACSFVVLLDFSSHFDEEAQESATRSNEE